VLNFAANFGADQASDLLAHTVVAVQALRRRRRTRANIARPCNIRRTAALCRSDRDQIQGQLDDGTRRDRFLSWLVLLVLRDWRARTRADAAERAVVRRADHQRADRRRHPAAPPQGIDRGRQRQDCRGRRSSAARAAQTIDAKGRTVAPGFIDMHSHSDIAR
jgi:hypothetical protein